MNPKELPHPKGPKVEPIDRRGKLIAFKTQLAKGTSNIVVHKDESPAEKLHRIKDDPAPDVLETREIIAHYLPFIELVEIEQMLAVSLGHAGLVAKTSGGLSEVLREAARLQILNGEMAHQGEDIRFLRNALFHDGISLRPEQILKINQFWNKVRLASASSPELAIELKSLSDLGERDIEQTKPALAKISPIAYLVEIEQALRKVRNHITRRHPTGIQGHAPNKRYPDNGDALIAIKESRGKILHALNKLGFMRDLWLVVGLRNKILHIKADLKPDKDDAVKIERIWGACQNLGRIIRVNQSFLKIEQQLRELLLSRTAISGNLRYWSLQRLAKKASEDSIILKQLEPARITKSKLLAVAKIGKKAEGGTMNAPTRDEFELLQEICLQISSADKEVKKVGPLDDLPKSKRQKLLEIEDRNDKKKSRRRYRD